jgi:TctA family transporter
MIEENLRIGLIKSDGNFGAFFTRPISLVLFIILLLLFFYDPLKKLISRYVFRRKPSEENG